MRIFTGCLQRGVAHTEIYQSLRTIQTQGLEVLRTNRHYSWYRMEGGLTFLLAFGILLLTPDILVAATRLRLEDWGYTPSPVNCMKENDCTFHVSFKGTLSTRRSDSVMILYNILIHFPVWQDKVKQLQPHRCDRCCAATS